MELACLLLEGAKDSFTGDNDYLQVRLAAIPFQTPQRSWLSTAFVAHCVLVSSLLATPMPGTAAQHATCLQCMQTPDPITELQ